MLLLSVKMGFFHRIARKALWGPVWEGEVLVRLIGVEINAPRFPVPPPGQVAQLCPAAEVQSCLPHARKQHQGPETLRQCPDPGGVQGNSVHAGA